MKPEKQLTERNIKSLLVQYLREIGAAKGAKVLSELCVAGFSRRADVVLVNGNLSAYEIKGEFDTLDRLNGQIETFSSYFEALTIVCAPKHTSRVLALASEDIGVWEVTGNSISVKRSARVETSEDFDVWLSYLPVRILKQLLAKHQIRPAGRNRAELVIAAKTLSVSVIRNAVLDYLKARGSAPYGFRVARNKPRQLDPIQLNDLRVQEFLALLKLSGESLQAIPRLVKQASE